MRLFGGSKTESRKPNEALPPLTADFNLTQLADRYGSDKGSKGLLPHDYTLLYDMLLGPRRASVQRMLEIGLLINGPEVGIDADRTPPSTSSKQPWGPACAGATD